MIHISLFSGIGGFDLASEWIGWNNVSSCEINPFCNRILEYYWPNSYHHDDIKTFSYNLLNEELKKRFDEQWRNQDVILTGGFPCQPYSIAGKRLGKEDDRHLWPEMYRFIRELSPTYIVGENVYGIVNWDGGLVFNEVQVDLENEGYEVQPVILPACSVNAPHKRDRVWFVAYSSNARIKSLRFRGENSICEPKATTNTDDTGNTALRIENNRIWKESGDEWGQSQLELSRSSSTGIISYPDNQGMERYVSEPTKTKRTIRKEGESWNCSDNWLFNWSNFPTQSPVYSGNDGISSELDGITFPKWRNESIKAYGNAIVPQVAYQIFKAIDYHNKKLI